MNDIEKIKTNFLAAFNLEKNGFYKPVFFTECAIGFGTLRDLDPKIKDRLHIASGKEYKTLLRVYIKDDDLNNQTIQKKPLIIKIHFNLSAGDGLFREQFDYIKRHRYQPVDLVSKDYFYDVEKNIFYNNKGIICAEQILIQVYNSHIKPTKIFSGFYLRLKLFFWHNFLPVVFTYIYKVFVAILYIISGEEFTYDVIKNYVDNLYFKNTSDYKKEEPKLNPPKTIKDITIFGYSASPWSICAYCVLHFAVYSIMYFNDYKPQYIKYLLTNNFAIIIYVIPTISFFEALLPKIIKYFIKKSTFLSVNLSMKEVKI